MIDLREKDRIAICKLAKIHLPQGSEIWAYGSRVKGTNHDCSDLDLVVHFPPDQSRLECLSVLDDFIEALKESNIPIIVQALAWNSIPDYFQSSILERYEVLIVI